MVSIREAVYATLLMNDVYLPGAMVLAHSLKDRGATARLVVLATIDNLSAAVIAELKTIYDEVISIPRIVNQHPANLYLMDRPDLISTFTKIELWRQTQFSQVVYIDADMVALRAPNELLTYDADFAAVPDIGWPDCFNSGLLVLRPNLGDYYSLLALAQRGISFDGADQGLLNMHFQHWQRLSFTYNCTPSGSYQYVPAYKHFQSSISLIHFIGRDKPWTTGRDYKNPSGVYGELLGRWWATYDKHYRVHASYYLGNKSVGSRTVQNLVAGEKTTAYLGFAPAESRPGQDHPPSIDHPSEVQDINAENDVRDQPETIEQLDAQTSEPARTMEHRPFSAPQSEWDASRAPPPVDSKPEASNFPSQVYTFNQDTSLFQPPRYPKAPRDMYYSVPPESTKLGKPKPIFPWEEHAPKATRVFPAEPAPDPAPGREAESGPAVSAEALTDASEGSQDSRPNVSSPQSESDGDSWSTYTRANAWDSMPEIERYVQAFAQARQGKIQVLHEATPVLGASHSPPPARRSSMKLTDFPTEVERPSLPVTPAPRRPSFWGEERDEAGELPAAEGVPKQEDWNPVQKLEELQIHQSEVLQSGPDLLVQELPNRAMPGSVADSAATALATTPTQANTAREAAAMPTTNTTAIPASTTTNALSSRKPRSILKEPSFELGSGGSDEASPAANDMVAGPVVPDVTTSA